MTRIEVGDIKNMKLLAKRKDLLVVLGSSIAPSIEGHIGIKKAILL